MKVHIITVGDEILIGHTVDTNSAWMGQELNQIGAEVIEITTVADEHGAILHRMEKALAKADIVLMTGGLGPTKDDITKKALADFFKTEMVFHEESFERLTKIFERFGLTVRDSHRIQCFLPENAEVIKNDMGTAPGMWFEYKEKVIVSMPGVPHEMKYIMENGVMERLKRKFKAQPIAHRSIMTAGAGESQLAKLIEDLEESLPYYMKLAYLPALGQVKLRLTARGKNEYKLGQELDELKEVFVERIGEYVYGYEDISIEEAIGNLLKEKKLTLSTAESCTGGYIAHRITGVPGASEYFLGSVVSYDNRVKMNSLGVKSETLKSHGAVSEETVKEMVSGAVAGLGTDIAVATSGIMGPGGGTSEKPVGTVWIAVGIENEVRTHQLSLTKNRLKNIEYTGNFTLNFLRKFLLELK